MGIATSWQKRHGSAKGFIRWFVSYPGVSCIHSVDVYIVSPVRKIGFPLSDRGFHLLHLLSALLPYICPIRCYLGADDGEPISVWIVELFSINRSKFRKGISKHISPYSRMTRDPAELDRFAGLRHCEEVVLCSTYSGIYIVPSLRLASALRLIETVWLLTLAASRQPNTPVKPQCRAEQEAQTPQQARTMGAQ